ncbi:MAG TPA: hypothetical protein VGU64_10475, partial [Terriglobales bacterium]|nr:hypothetical protein [Terriglobales bacterium]
SSPLIRAKIECCLTPRTIKLDDFIFNGILYKMLQVKVDFYEDAQGNAPVERFLDSLRPEARAKA